MNEQPTTDANGPSSGEAAGYVAVPTSLIEAAQEIVRAAWAEVRERAEAERPADCISSRLYEAGIRLQRALEAAGYKA